MRQYEIMYILNPTLSKEEIQKVRGELEHAITNKKGKLLREDIWGIKDLAYEIEKHKQGYYVVINVEATSEAIIEFNRLAQINKARLRHMIVQIDLETIIDQEKLISKIIEEQKKEWSTTSS